MPNLAALHEKQAPLLNDGNSKHEDYHAVS